MVRGLQWYFHNNTGNYTDGVTYSFGVFYNVLLNYFKEGSGATSWIASILVGVTLCSGPIASALVNRYGCRAVTIAGALLASFCLCISMFAENVATLYVTVGLLTGLGLGLIYLPAIVSVTCYFEKYRSLATGIAVCGSGLGTFLIAPLTQFLVDEYSWRGAFLITGALMLNCVVFGILFRPLVGPIEEEVELKTVETNRKEADKAVANGEQKRPHSIHGGPVPIVAVSGRTVDNARLALSQPMLTLERRRSNQWGSGIMYRKDVLYSGSLANIHHHHKTRSASWLPGDLKKGEDKPLMGASGDGKAEDMTLVCGCIPCATETADTLHEMLDFSLLKDPIFILFTVSNFCTSIGFNVPYVYIVPQAVSGNKLTDNEASYLLSIIGIANTFGRVVLGYLADKKWMNRLWIYNTSLALCGLGTALSVYSYDFLTFAIYAATFGFTVGAYVGLTSVILVDLLGLDKLTNAFGLLLLFQGLASLIGPPITGWLKDWTTSYDPGFIVSGLMIAISGLMLFAVPSFQRWLETRERLDQTRNGAALSS